MQIHTIPINGLLNKNKVNGNRLVTHRSIWKQSTIPSHSSHMYLCKHRESNFFVQPHEAGLFKTRTELDNSGPRQTTIFLSILQTRPDHVHLVYTCMYTVYTHAHAHAHAHAHMHAHAHTYPRTHTHTHTRTHAWTHTHTHVRTHAHTHARTHTRTHACTHTRTHAHTHARTHTHTHARTHAPTHMLQEFFFTRSWETSLVLKGLRW